MGIMVIVIATIVTRVSVNSRTLMLFTAIMNGN